jgi:hypothetical protein
MTAFIDRWRPKTHSFHLPSGEMFVLMKDVGYILGICLDSPVVIGMVDTQIWKDMVEQFTRHRPPDPEEVQKEKKTSGVNSAWLRQRFNKCPPHALADIIERHARVWLWHMVAQFLFLDASWNIVSWMVLPQLREPWENIAQYSWGSATLAWLYRQLCEACRRAQPNSNLGGWTYLLQIWIWEHIPIRLVHRGRVAVSTFTLNLYMSFISFVDYVKSLHLFFQNWTHGDSRPPVCYLWTGIKSVRGQPQRCYVQYSNDLDVLTTNQVHSSTDAAFIFLEELTSMPCTKYHML